MGNKTTIKKKMYLIYPRFAPHAQELVEQLGSEDWIVDRRVVLAHSETLRAFLRGYGVSIKYF